MIDVPLELEFSPPSAGWINITVTGNGFRFVESFSYVRPPLASLCAALCDLGNGLPTRAVVLLLEPDEIELRFEPATPGRTMLVVAGFRDHRRGGEIRESVILSHESDTRALVTLFWRALQRLETSLAAEDFERAWRSPFPARELQALGSLVETWQA